MSCRGTTRRYSVQINRAILETARRYVSQHCLVLEQVGLVLVLE